MSLEQVGSKIGCSKGHLSICENGKGNMSLPLFLDFCKAISTPPSKVLGDLSLPRARDIDLLSAEIVSRNGITDLRWLASLDRVEFRVAIKGAHDQLDLDRLRSRERQGSSKPKSR